jgi:hypothetical protein
MPDDSSSASVRPSIRLKERLTFSSSPRAERMAMPVGASSNARRRLSLVSEGNAMRPSPALLPEPAPLFT